MPSTPSHRVAIIGSGPSGCYFAQALLRGAPEVEITIFDKLASPYGLVRYGVAADHQHTKAITRQFERLFADPRVRFAGNIDVGQDVSLETLQRAYDAVVLATGLSADRPLQVPGNTLPGVYGAGMLTRILNSHPGERPVLPPLGSDVVLVGGGNVAIDLLRFLVKDRDGYDESDVSDDALDQYLSSPAERVTVLHRSDPASAKSDPQMLKELAALPRGHYSSPDLESAAPASEGDRQGAARLAAFTELVSADRSPTSAPLISLRFGVTPLRILGTDRVEGIEITTSAGVETIPATSVVTAIGFEHDGSDIASLTAEPAPTGRLATGLYRTGWAKRGPQGAIPENRTCAKQVADEFLADLKEGKLSSGSPGFSGLHDSVQAKALSFPEWTNLDQYERELAPTGRVRRKLTDHETMVSIARQAQQSERNPQS